MSGIFLLLCMTGDLLLDARNCVNFTLLSAESFSISINIFGRFFWCVVKILGNSLILSILAFKNCQLEPVQPIV